MLKYKIPQIVTLTQKSHRISNFLLHQIAYFCGQYINKKPLKYSYFSDFHDFPFCKSGATRNRAKFTSGCISSLFRNIKRVISSYCSTVGLLRFAQGCVKVSKCKGNELL